MPTYLPSIRSPAPPLGSFCSQWIEGERTSYMELVVTSSWSQWLLVRHSESMQLPFNDFCCGCRSAEEEIVIVFLCQWTSLSRCRYRLFGSPTLFNDIVSFIKLSAWGIPWADQLLPPWFGGTWSVQRLRSLMVSQRASFRYKATTLT